MAYGSCLFIKDSIYNHLLSVVQQACFRVVGHLAIFTSTDTAEATCASYPNGAKYNLELQQTISSLCAQQVVLHSSQSQLAGKQEP